MPVASWWLNASATAEVRVEVQEVPGLVAQPAPDRDRGRDDDGDEQREPGDRGDHAGIAGDQPVELVEQRDPVADRVAGRDQRGVREQQRERDAAVDAVDDGEPLEARRCAPAAGCGRAAAARRARGRRRAARRRGPAEVSALERSWTSSGPPVASHRRDDRRPRWPARAAPAPSRRPFGPVRSRTPVCRPLRKGVNRTDAAALRRLPSADARRRHRRDGDRARPARPRARAVGGRGRRGAPAPDRGGQPGAQRGRRARRRAGARRRARGSTRGAARPGRCAACRSRSRTTSRPPGCRWRSATRSARASSRTPTPPPCGGCARPARSCSARPTARPTAAGSRPTTPSTGARATPTTRRARRAARAAARRRSSARPAPRSASAPTRAAACGCRRTSAGWPRSSRPRAACRSRA